MIDLKSHAMFDYLIAATLIVAPYLFNFSDIAAARNIFLALGTFMGIYCALTRYEIALFNVIPLGVHMVADIFMGLLLMLSPTLFSYQGALNEIQYALHLAVGVLTVALVALTWPKSESETLSHSQFLPRY